MSEGFMKSAIKSVFHRMGYRVLRLRPLNRFDAMFDSLALLRDRGFAPRVVIDGGANMGTWSRDAMRIFPDAEFHLIEPQAACLPALERFARQSPRVTIHPVAVTEPGVADVSMFDDGHGGGTGTYVLRVANHTAAGTVVYPATTIDELFATKLSASDRVLLKLDLETHELTALRGAERVLDMVEVLLTELRFFEINDDGGPVFTDVMDFMRSRDFELYDFACLSPRPRDLRLRMGDVIFVRRGSPLLADRGWA